MILWINKGSVYGTSWHLLACILSGKMISTLHIIMFWCNTSLSLSKTLQYCIFKMFKLRKQTAGTHTANQNIWIIHQLDIIKTQQWKGFVSALLYLCDAKDQRHNYVVLNYMWKIQLSGIISQEDTYNCVKQTVLKIFDYFDIAS